MYQVDLIVHFEGAVFPAVVIVDFDFYGASRSLNALDIDAAIFPGLKVIDLDRLTRPYKVTFFDLNSTTELLSTPSQANATTGIVTRKTAVSRPVLNGNGNLPSCGWYGNHSSLSHHHERTRLIRTLQRPTRS